MIWSFAWVALWPTFAAAQALCDVDVSCEPPPADGEQLCTSYVDGALERAANGVLFDAGPSMPELRRGCGTGARQAGRVPCQLLKAVAWAASGWVQFCTGGCGPGEAGPTLVGAGCRYGLMQLVGSEGLDLHRAASELEYNAGAGARLLADGWNATACVGDRDPDATEHWYHAVWFAAGFTYADNPNNPAFPVVRGTYRTAGGFDRGSYPFQEIVWGLAGNPPTRDGERLWNPSKLGLPSSKNICSTEHCPANIPSPEPTHGRQCPALPPPRDAGSPDGSPPDAAVDSALDSGDPAPSSPPTGCRCEAGGSRLASTGWPMLLAALSALLFRRGKSTQDFRSATESRWTRCRSSTRSGRC